MLFEKSQLSKPLFSDEKISFFFFVLSFSLCKEEEKEGAKLSIKNRVNFTR